MPSSSLSSALSGFADLRRREQKQPDLARGREGERLFRIEIEGVGGAELEIGVGQAQREHAIAARELLGDPVARREVDF